MSGEVYFINDTTICAQFQEYSINIPGYVMQNGVYQHVQLKYSNGKLLC